jgi:uncharacterized membrane protein YfcA
MGWSVGELVLLLGASAGAGAINAVAGGGTLLSFPAAMAVGLPSLEANATNSAALTVASLASAWGYRRELAEEKETVRWLLLPSLLGGLGGAALLKATPQRVFDALVPVLLLVATALLALQNLRGGGGKAAEGRRGWLWMGQLGVAVYGGYFGAGMGIVMLALLDHLGGDSLHRKNALKVILGVAINGVAALWLLGAGTVRLDAAALMALGASAGGWGGAALARRLDGRKVRWAVVALGFALTSRYLWKLSTAG